jgi:hypothetical protein
MNHIRRAFALTAAGAIVTVAASACGGPATATGPPANGTTSACPGAATPAGPPANGTTAATNGLESKSVVQVLQAADAAFWAAQSVHIVGSNSDGPSDYRMDRSSAIAAITLTPTEHAWIRVVGRYGYKKTDYGPYAGRWLRSPAGAFPGFTLADHRYDGLTEDHRYCDAKAQQATVNGKKVIVVSWPDGSTLQIANTGSAYPLRADFKGDLPGREVYSEYNVPFNVTAPRDAIDAPKGS